MMDSKAISEHLEDGHLEDGHLEDGHLGDGHLGDDHLGDEHRVLFRGHVMARLNSSKGSKAFGLARDMD